MNTIAIDIVLLPSQETVETVIRLNQSLVQQGSEIVLNMNDCLPHLSLAMGGLKEEALPIVTPILDDIASRLPPVHLIFTEIDTGVLATGEITSTLRLERTPALQTLHETVMRRMAPYLDSQVTAEMFIDFPVQTASVHWVNTYPTAASFDRFSPHITLGVGGSGRLGIEGTLPDPGIASRLALCHLGNDCTCRKILFETALKGGSAIR